MPGWRNAAAEVIAEAPRGPLDAQSSFRLGGLSLLAGIALYPLLWWLAFNVSNSYWFLPVGVRVAALLLLPPRHWPWLVAGEYLVTGLMVLASPAARFTVAGSVMAVGVPWLMYALAVTLWRRRFRERLPRTPQSFALLLILAMAAAALAGINLLMLRALDGRLQDVQSVEVLFSLLIGDFVGLLVLAPLLVQIGDPQAAWRQPRVWRELASTLLPLGLVLWGVAQGQSAALPYVALFAIVPPLWLARSNGWRGAAMAFTGVSALVYFNTVGHVEPRIGSLLQVFLALVGSATLLLGAWNAFERRLREQLEGGMQELGEANARLQAQAQEMRDLGQRLVNAQEDERRRIRGELRGELSQQITALGTQLALLARRVDRPELMAMVDGLRTHVQAIRDAADECLDSLQPRAMMRSGLRGALVDGPLAGTLAAAGIAYAVQISGDDQALAEDDQLTVYRIAQHIAATSLRYSDAASVELRVLVVGAPPEWVEIDAVLRWRTPLSVEALAAEPDVQAMRDRMFACGGVLDLDALDEGRMRLLMRFAARAGTASASRKDAVAPARSS